MKKFGRQIITFLFLLTNTLLYGQVTKIDNWETAREMAETENKDILIILTGSEWCRPCVRMEKDVIEQTDFVDFANSSFVIFEINLPKHLDLNSKVVKDYNYFKNKYQTNSLPSLILVDKNGTEKTRITNGRLSADNVIKKLKQKT
jgi:thioredoxin-related protein